jgi:hypothetical protein
MMFNRGWRIQNIRPYTLDMNSKRRHEFKTIHSFRKFFETRALEHMKLLNVKLLMGHDTGLERSYYKTTEAEILQDYLRSRLAHSKRRESTEEKGRVKYCLGRY